MTDETQLQSGLYVPSSAKRSVTSRQEFNEEKRLKGAANEAKLLTNLLLWLSAITTFSFGFIASINQYPDLSILSSAGFVQALLYAGIAGLILTGLVDGTRYGWAQAEIAKGTQTSQQWIAAIMKWLNFMGSLIASIIALPVLLDFLGIGFQFNQIFLLGVLKILIQTAMGLNVFAAMLYVSLSPENRRLSSLANMNSNIEKLSLDKLEQINEQVETNTDEELDKYLVGMAEDRQRAEVARFLNRYSLPTSQTVGNDQPAGTDPDPEFAYQNGNAPYLNGHR